ncbi:MAG: PadR family transcriptional regulator [Candidatus Thorarchaeota archaeon]|nr:PadR family transcriptional regulator [Candidatus Thorarchaeota archaeon]
MCSPHPHRHYGPHGNRGGHGDWKRRMARVPKGYLRHNVLKLLKENPMSGSEIITAIADKTDGRWKPSPGSVYPLLSWLLDSGYTTEAPEQEAGIKRYELTEKGVEFSEEHEKRAKEFEERAHGFGASFEGFPEEAKELIASLKALRKASRKLFRQMKKEYSEEKAKEAKALVDDFVTKINMLTEKTEA